VGGSPFMEGRLTEPKLRAAADTAGLAARQLAAYEALTGPASPACSTSSGGDATSTPVRERGTARVAGASSSPREEGEPPSGAPPAEPRRPLLIGEAPSRQGDRYWRFPLSGNPARVLCQLAGIPPDPESTGPGKWTWALYEHFNCVNLIERYADAEPWSAPRAREVARAFKLRPVNLLLGRRVAVAFRLEDEPLFRWADIGQGRRAVCLPHPSGLNRKLNDPGMREEMGRVLREVIKR
jgi:hypothetical protein